MTAAERLVSRIGSSEEENSPRHKSCKFSPLFSYSKRVAESSPEPQASTSYIVVAGGWGVEPSVSKMLKKIVAKTEKKECGKTKSLSWC